MAVTITEEPVTIAEEPVTIAEEPVTIPEEPATIAEDPVAPTIEAPVEPQPKKRGRPAGSKNKEPGKPRAPRKKPEIVQEPVEPVQELPRAVEGSFPIPEEAYDLRTAKMLRVLQIQADRRKRNKENVWRNLYG